MKMEEDQSIPLSVFLDVSGAHEPKSLGHQKLLNKVNLE